MLLRKFEIFVANRLIGGRKSSKSIRPVVIISIIAIALSSAVMIITAAIIRGFKAEITEKVTGFGSHILVSHYNNSNTYESIPFNRATEIENLHLHENVNAVQPFITKAGILKNGDLIQANILKGVSEDYNWNFFENNLLEGRLPDVKNGGEILLSSNTADALNVKANESILLFFIQDPPRVRKLKVTGVYSSGFAQFDDLVSITDMSLLQKINDWDSAQISGYEILVDDYTHLDETAEAVYLSIPHNLNAMTIEEKHPDIFNWLELQDVNYIIILLLMIFVAAINSISALIILILEKTRTIGVLKTIGSSNISIRRIFMLQGAYLLMTGLVLGDVIGLGLGLIQHQFEVIKLPVESYYLASVPINLNFSDLVLINIGTIVLCLSSLILPSLIISKIEVSKVLKFD